MIGIRPTVDFAFKLMLGNPEHTTVTIHFLNAILGDRPKITHVEILNPFLGKEAEKDKLSVLDILATDEHDRKLNIEMQTTLPAGISQRLAYYAARLYVTQLAEGGRYPALRPAISNCVLSKAMFPGIPNLHLDFRLRESTGQLLTDDLQIHLLELSKLRVSAQNVYHASPMERWAYFLQNAEKLTHAEVEQMFPDREFTEAAGVLEMISQTPEQQRQYDARLKFQLDEAARLEFAREQALREGEEKGRVEGRREGKLLGRIAILQELLGVEEPTSTELSSYNEDQLSELAEQLQGQLRNRGQ